LFSIPLKPYVIARVRTPKACRVKTFLEVKPEMALKRPLLPWIDPHLNTNYDIMITELLDATHFG
jgi:hypothetical protein